MTAYAVNDNGTYTALRAANDKSAYTLSFTGSRLGVFALTDLLDGYIARSRNLITNFGKFMDPIADKLLTHTAFIMLTAIGRLNVTACIIFIAREFVVSGLRLCAVDGKVDLEQSPYWAALQGYIKGK